MLTAALFVAVMAFAAPPKISSKLAKSAIIMGDKTMMEVQVVADRGVTGRFLIFDGVARDSVVSLLNDSVELSADYSVSSIDLGSGRSQTDYHIPVQSFDSGYYSLPPVAYVIGQDTLYTSSMPLKVVPVNASKDDPISGFTDTMPPGEGKFYDHIPLWLLEWWWVMLTFAMVAVALLLFFMKYRRVVGKRKKRALPPYEEAVEALDSLASRKLWQKGEQKEYFTVLTDIMRRYISRRFGIQAEEMSTTEILASVREHKRLKPYLEQFKAVLAVADFAKFANMQCTPEENTGAFEEVRKFVEDTRPTEEEKRAEAEKMKKSDPKPRAHWEKRNSKATGNRKTVKHKGKEVKK